MKKIILIYLLFFLSMVNFSYSQTTITIGTGTSTQRYPLGNYYGYERSAALYTASEITIAGTITKLGWYATLSRTAVIPIKIYLKQTTATSLTSTTWSSIISGATLVFDGNNNSITANAWNEFDLTTSFSYNGIDNLLVLVEANYGGPGILPSSGVGVRYSTSTDRHQYWQADYNPPTGNGTLNSNRPNIQITLQTSDMTYESSTTEQASTSIVPIGSTDQPVIGLKVVTSGSQNPFNVTSITFTTNGTTNTSDLTAAKVYYTTSPTFSTSTQFGSTINNPDGTLTFTGSQQLATGNNYFWLAYDISSSATVNNVVDGTCTQFVTSDGPTTRNPDVTDPAGSRTIKAPVSGTINVGSGEEYTSLTGSGGLFEAINLLGLSGNLEVLITSYLSEDGTNALNQWTETGGGGYYLTIKPSSNTVRTISGSYSGGLIRLNGADRVTIDGRYGGSGNYLTISNTATSGTIAAIQLISLGTGQGCENVTIRNCNISTGSNTITTSYGISVGGSTIGTTGNDNDNLSIIENVITKCWYGIYVGAGSAGVNNSLNIYGNTIGSNSSSDYVIFRGINLLGADGANIYDNTIFNLQTSDSYNIAAIDLGSDVTNSNIYRNRIYGLRSTSTDGWGAYGINISSSTNNTNNTIHTNVIYDIITANFSTTSTTSNAFGIRIAGGTNHKIYYNSVNLFGNVTSGSNAGMSAAFLVTTTLVTGIDIRNNIFVNSTNFAVSGSKSYAIYVPSGVTFGTIDRNDYFVSGTYGILGYFWGDKTTLSDWQTATGQDANSISANPMFTGDTDLRPASGSPVLGAGTPISGITIDFLGDSRDATTPSMGAYENPFILSTPPNCPVLISPANASTGVSVQPTLQWSDGGGGTTGYKLYFGTDNPPTNIHNGTDLGNVTSYTFSSNLNYLTTYYWRIVSYNNNGDASGCEVRSFTTSSDPTVIPKLEQFNLSSFPAGWSQMFSGDLTSNRWIVDNSNNAGGNPYEMVASYEDATGVSRLIVGPLNTTNITSLTLKFRHYYDDYGTGATFKIQSSADNSNWTDESYSFNSGGDDLGPEIITTTISNNLGAQTYIAWTIDGNHGQFDYWYIDDVQIYVTPSASNTQNISGGNTNPTTFTGTGTTIQFTTANTGAVDLSVERINSSPGGPLPSGLTNLGPVYWNINVTSGTVNGTYSITFDVSGVSGVNNPSTLRLLKRNNPNEPWTDLGVPNNVNGTLLTWTGLTSFSEFGMGGGGDNPLPVQLSSFTASTKGRDVILNWTTATEINTAGFEIERKLISQEKSQAKWENVGFVRGNVNSNRPIEYTFTDTKLNTGKYAYRLKMIDNDGSYEYSDEVQVEIGKPDVTKIEQNYPNAFNPATKIEYQLANPSKVVIEVYNITGEKIAELVNSEQVEGYYSLVFDASKYGLASGIYFYRMIAMDRVTGKNVVQTKKMLYLK